MHFKVLVCYKTSREHKFLEILCNRYQKEALEQLHNSCLETDDVLNNILSEVTSSIEIHTPVYGGYFDLILLLNIP